MQSVSVGTPNPCAIDATRLLSLVGTAHPAAICLATVSSARATASRDRILPPVEESSLVVMSSLDARAHRTRCAARRATAVQEEEEEFTRGLLPLTSCQEDRLIGLDYTVLCHG